MDASRFDHLNRQLAGSVSRRRLHTRASTAGIAGAVGVFAGQSADAACREVEAICCRDDQYADVNGDRLVCRQRTGG